MSPSIKIGGAKMFSMEKVEKDAFSTKDEFFRFEEIAESTYFCNLIALIIAVIFCLFLFRII
jgi:hypothetical protein